MKLEYVKRSVLKERPVNPRIHNTDVIGRSIERFGWIQPIVVDADYRIVDGHGRLHSVDDDTLIPVVVLDRAVSDEEALSISAALHRSVGIWDWSQQDALERVKEWFDEKYLDELRSQLNGFWSVSDIWHADITAEKIQEPVAEAGQVIPYRNVSVDDLLNTYSSSSVSSSEQIEQETNSSNDERILDVIEVTSTYAIVKVTIQLYQRWIQAL